MKEAKIPGSNKAGIVVFAKTYAAGCESTMFTSIKVC